MVGKLGLEDPRITIRRRLSISIILRAAANAGALLLAVLPAVTAVAQETPADPQPVAPELLRDFVPVTDAMLLQPRPENWISFRNGYDF